MRAIVYRDVCIGCGACEGVAPDVYELDSESISVPKIEGDLPEDLIEAAQEGRDSCPVDAISIEE